MKKDELTIKSEQIFDGKVVKLFVDDVSCPNGNKSKREFIKHNGGVCILGFIQGKVVIERQFRYAYKEELWELPAGKLEVNEDPYEAGVREFEEETGYKPVHMVDLGVMYPTCGYSNEKIYLFFADELVESERHLDPDECIELKYLTLEEVEDLINSNELKDAKSICLIYKYKEYVRKLYEKK